MVNNRSFLVYLTSQVTEMHLFCNLHKKQRSKILPLREVKNGTCEFVQVFLQINTACMKNVKGFYKLNIESETRCENNRIHFQKFSRKTNFTMHEEYIDTGDPI